MNSIYLQPATIRFKWELEVAISNLIDLGVTPEQIWLVFSIDKEGIPKYLYDT